MDNGIPLNVTAESRHGKWMLILHNAPSWLVSELVRQEQSGLRWGTGSHGGEIGSQVMDLCLILADRTSAPAPNVEADVMTAYLSQTRALLRALCGAAAIFQTAAFQHSCHNTGETAADYDAAEVTLRAVLQTAREVLK